MGMHGPQALVVDDEGDMRLLVGDVLRRCLPGVEVIEAEDAGAARRRWADMDGPALVISDLRMPGESGISLLTDLVAERGLGDAFVLLSTYVDDDVVRDALAAGVDDVLHKPVLIDDLEFLVRRIALDWHRAVPARVLA